MHYVEDNIFKISVDCSDSNIGIKFVKERSCNVLKGVDRSSRKFNNIITKIVDGW